MKIFAREGDQLFATLTVDEWSAVDAHRDSFAEHPEHRSGCAVGAEIGLDAWLAAAELVSSRRDLLEAFRDLIARQIPRLDEILAVDSDFEVLTVGRLSRLIRSIENEKSILETLRRHFAGEIENVDAELLSLVPGLER